MQALTFIFYVAAGIQIAFLCGFLIAFSRKRVEKPNPPSPISVIVCAHNEEGNLKELLPLLQVQDHPEFEIVIVNDRSSDGTFDFLLEAQKSDNRLKVIHVDKIPEHINAKKYAITLGIKIAVHTSILLTDADCRPNSRNWIRTMSSGFDEKTEIVLGYSPYRKEKGFLNAFIRFDTLLTAILYTGFLRLGMPYMGVGRNLAYRRALFMDNKGFNGNQQITGGDDDLFVNKHATGKNTRLITGVDALVYSIPKKTWRSFFRQKIRHLAVGKRYKLWHRIILGIFMISYLISWYAGISLIFWQPLNFWIPVMMIFRIIMLTLTTRAAVETFGDKFESGLVIFLDFVYSIYYISTGLMALLTKKVQWMT